MSNARDLQDVKKVVSGMMTDTDPIDQPQNSYRYALNMLLESREGNHAAITNEEGNEACGALKVGYQVIGSILINNNDVVLFSTNGTKSEIGILSESCVYTAIIESSCLNFSIDHYITGIYKIHNGCDRIIYFTDDFNPIRAINLDNLLQYTQEVTVDDANTNDTWICSLMSLDPDFEVPTIALTSVIDGAGNLERGTYMFTLRYLDADFNPTNWTDFTQVVPIYGGDSGTYNNVNGGNFDLTGNDLFIEGKAIQLDLTNLDPNFSYYQLGVIAVTDGNINEGAAYTLTQESYVGTNATYIYTGASTQETVAVLTDLTVDTVVFDKVKAIEQINNRMILGNTEDRTRDWAEFQRSTSQVVLNWGTNSYEKGDYPKNPEYMFYRRSYMRDEVYAFGLVYVFKDGTTSPVFHIPGRAADQGHTGIGVVTNAQMVAAGNANVHTRNNVPGGNGWDTQLLTVTASGAAGSDTTVSEDDVKHIPLSEFTNPLDPRLGNTIERWKVYNTATQGGGINNQLAYTEADTMYPEILDCAGNSIWGTDAYGIDLINTPIRHHKFPDATLTPHHDGAEADPTELNNNVPTPSGNVHPIFIQLRNVNYPAQYASEIQGYYLVRAQRNEEDRTIIDKGYLGMTAVSAGIYGPDPAWTVTDPHILTNPLVTPEEDNPYVFISNKTLFTNEIKDVGYFKSEFGSTNSTTTQSGTMANPITYQIHQGDVIRQARNEMNNISTLGYIYVDLDSIQPQVTPFSRDIENRTVTTQEYFTQWDRSALNPLFDAGATHQYASAKQWKKPYSNLFNITYINTGEMLTPNIPGFHNIYGGDTFITEVTWKHIRRSSNANFNDMDWRVFANYYLESTIHSEVRGNGTLDYETHLRKFQTSIIDYMELDQFPEDNQKDFAENYFRYNTMYSQENSFKTYAPLPITWDFCSECPNSFPYRLWYSNQSFQESRDDNYRQFQANNYQDLIGASGELNNLFVFKDQLYAQTEYATWFIPTRPQELQTNEGNISVGTGGIFSVPPRRIETADRGYAGVQHRAATVTSEFGTFWADADAGKVFLMQGKGPKDITLKGMRNWFAENLPFNIKDQLPNFEVDSHTSKNGVGLQAVLDPRHNRIILHKKDYRLVGAASSILETEAYIDPTPFVYAYNTTTREYYTHDGVSETIVDIIDNPELVEDKSWTVSLNLMGESWASFHSYKPYWMWNNRNRFFSYITDNSNAWRHGSRNYCSFYGEEPVPCVVDYIYNKSPYTTKVYNAIQYISKAEEHLNGKFKEVLWDTWDHMWVYNTDQSSGFLDISSKQDITGNVPFIEVVDFAHSPAYARDNEGTFSISEFYDLTIDKSLTISTEDWNNAAYQNARLAYGILDYPNDAATSLTKNPFELEPMRDKWLGVRLWYDNENAYKFSTDFVSTRNNISFK
jgi:hypothetical protein